MESRERMNRVLEAAARALERLGISSEVLGACRCGDEAEDRPRRTANGMNRVTDHDGKEFLCPVETLKDPNFVLEQEKANCFDYETISRAKAL